MTKPVKREYFSRGKGLLSAAGPQARFIVFLIFLLIGYTFLLKIFQKLTGIVDLPVFLPIALVSLLTFIGIAGTLYSHKFVGPVTRIRRTVEHVADGDCSVTLRLREADDPMMKELAQSITRLCDRSRQNHRALRDAAGELLREVTDLTEQVQKGVTGKELGPRIERIHTLRTALEQAVKALGN
ncbi:MAG: hypothetical protein OEW15_13580 [Nitrospirota bacterium]|nr:hypothetical protein [Nitrospirota bacterium]